jgi:hypothetical protein
MTCFLCLKRSLALRNFRLSSEIYDPFHNAQSVGYLRQFPNPLFGFEGE